MTTNKTARKYDWTWTRIDESTYRGTHEEAPMYRIYVEKNRKGRWVPCAATKYQGAWDGMDADKQPSGGVESYCKELLRRARWINSQKSKRAA